MGGRRGSGGGDEEGSKGNSLLVTQLLDLVGQRQRGGSRKDV